MLDVAVSNFDIDDGWALEEPREARQVATMSGEIVAPLERDERPQLDDGWNLDASEVRARKPGKRAERKREERPKGAPSQPSRIVRLPGRVVIYPRRAVREKKLSALWDAVLAQGA